MCKTPGGNEVDHYILGVVIGPNGIVMEKEKVDGILS